MEVGGHRGPTLDQNLQHLAPAELVEDPRRGRPTSRGRGGPGPSAGAWPSTTRRGSRPAASRTVREGSSARTVPAPTRMASLSARRRWPSARASGAGDPLAGAVGCRRASVEGGRQLEHDPWPPRRAVLQVGGQLSPDLVGAHSGGYVDSGLADPFDACAPHPDVGIVDAHHDPPHTRGDQGVGARRSATGVAARLQGHVHRRAGCSVAGEGQGGRLGMGSARRLGGADDRRAVTLGNDHAADPRVRGRGRGGHRRPAMTASRIIA